MKANELMIGDWVRLKKDYVVDKDENIKLTSLDIHRIDEGDYVVEPIPLTDEILRKNGFWTEPNVGYIIDDYSGTQIIYDSWNHNLRIIENYKVRLDIETFNDLSVHELQHALRICEIIEREIEL